ncbi:MAG TPA: biotin carboxylase N-terminal domain-containing protein [Frankiaceae bacterium]|nr:biotin carboxylase N-terminal domain-containing protein [Frankiaceae bacterium]
MFSTVLVANRGEIAVRVIRTLRRMGIRSVAVYSDADAGARHVCEADVAVRLGPAAPRESYLAIDRVLAAASATGADAVHPGYGFLAENAAFAQACADAGVTFIGPPIRAVEVMGDKIRAKAAVVAAGVPVVPGASEAGMTDEDLIAASAEVGFPVLVKPSAGGGGKGMRQVSDPAELPEALRSARREAASSFGDDTLFLERFVTAPRHIEVQVIADAHGHTVHLGERECSLQRRHQKVIEEAPSALLDQATRDRIGAAAVETARTVGYTGAGTVEFLVSDEQPDEFFFLEMNTRLQVEHPVTELVTGLDLVELQVRIAAGEPLPFTQDGVRLTGHAVEARVYAEDPARGFLPTGGPALLVREPAGEGIRVDSSLVEGGTVATTYDPMLAKVIAWAPDRATALGRLDTALRETAVLGFGTNVAFLRALVTHPDVRAGRLDTGLIERHLDALTSSDVPDFAYVAYALSRRAALGPGADPWDSLTGFRLSGRAPVRFDVLATDGSRLTLTVTGPLSDAGELPDVKVQIGERSAVASAEPTDDGLLLTFDGVTAPVLVRDGWVGAEGSAWHVVDAPPLRTKADATAADGEVRSPMPGSVVDRPAEPGAAVVAGEALLVIEAMKMEHVLRAPVAGTVDLLVRVGDQVAVDQVLARVVPVADTPGEKEN